MGREQEELYKNEDGIVQDDYRIEFISQHLYHLLRGVKDGSTCEGYMLWAFTDCVSPMNAFKNRYGLVRIELDKQRTRSLKKSAYWYRSLVDDRKLIVEDEKILNRKMLSIICINSWRAFVLRLIYLSL